MSASVASHATGSSDAAPEAAPPATAPTGRFPGWRVVAGCFIVLTVSSGLAFYGLAVYLNALSNEQGWPLGQISAGTTIFFVVSGATGLVVARLIAEHDVRYVMIAGAVIAGGALALLGQVDSQWQLYLVYAVFAVGFAACGLVPATTVVTRWFHVRRSVALSVASTGLSVGGILLTPLAKRLIDENGLAVSTPWLGLMMVVGIVPVAWFLVRPDPVRDGWAPDGARLAAGASPPPPTGVHYGDAVTTRFYRAVTWGYVLALGSQVGGIQQLVKLVEERTDPETARFAITAVAATSVVARLAGGRIVQFVPMTKFTAAVAGVQAVSLVFLAVAESTAALFLAIVLFGVTIGNLLMLQPLLIAERFGVVDYARIYSRSQFIVIIGVAGGPLLLGWLYDESGSYRVPYVTASVLCVFGAALIAVAGPATLRGNEPGASEGR
ncbi:MAG: MFS transporter [Ilumatobacteraceae bacterium]